MTDVITFRDTVRSASPPWLKNGRAEKILYAVAIQLDALGEALVAGVKIRFPNLYSAESLPLIGRERRIRRGRLESDATYATRLLRWLDDHRHRGGPYALLAQLHAHYAPASFAITLIYYSGRRFTMAVDGSVVRDEVVWHPDGNAAKWARWWLFYDWPDSITLDDDWGSGTWGDGGVWGSSLTVDDVTDLRLVPREWNAAHPFGRIVLLNNAETWDFPPELWDDGGLWDSANSAIELDVV